MGRHHLEQCPFCNGHHCFSINSQKGFYKCFQCPAQGDVFTFLEAYHNLSKAEALKKAAEMAGVRLEGGMPSKAGDRTVRRMADKTVRDKVLEEAAAYYHARMLTNGGRDYLVKTRKHTEEVLRSMKVGWADGGLVEHLRGKGFSEEEIEASGLGKRSGRTGSLRDFFAAGVAVFPHLVDDRVLHFTMKDPAKKLGYQLPSASRSAEWTFYNQAALRHQEIIVVEGENDLLSVLGSGARNVVGLIGQVSDEQVKALKTASRGKYLYLWLDKDHGGDKQVEKICHALRYATSGGTGLGESYRVRIIRHPGEAKDPDEYLRAFGGDRRKEVKRLQDAAADFISWQIERVGESHEDLGGSLAALKERKIFAAVAGMVLAEREAFIQRLAGLGFSREAIEEQLETDLELKERLGALFEQAGGARNADPNLIARAVFEYFSRAGRFFRDSADEVYLLHQHRVYVVGNNRPFNALIKKASGLLPTKEPGRSLWEALASDAYNYGEKIDLASWLRTDRLTDTIFVNLNAPGNMILKVNRESIEEVPNGLNAEGVLLRSSPRIMPLNFRPEASVREGMEEMKRLVFDNLTCQPEQRYLVLCWLVSVFLLELSPYMALLKFSGATASGKTTAARLISILLYGTDQLGDPTASAAYSVAAQNPLLVIDNLESADATKSMEKFLLLAATRGGKEKRAGGTDSDTIQERPKSLVLLTAIEPFTKAELINRTYDIEFTSSLKRADFLEDEVVAELTRRRDLILSAVLKFIHKEVLPHLEQRRDFITILKKEHKGHAKDRTDEYLALLMLVLEKLLRHIPLYGEDDFLQGADEAAVRRAWVEYQHGRAREMETSSNTILKLLDGLAREYLLKMRALAPEQPGAPHGYNGDVTIFTHEEYHLEALKSQAETIEEDGGEKYSRAFFEFQGTSSDLCAAFDRYCRNQGIRNPYSTAAIFGARLRNDRHLLEKGGWELVARLETDPYFRVVRGQRYFKFRKALIR
jgi:DNA primase